MNVALAFIKQSMRVCATCWLLCFYKWHVPTLCYLMPKSDLFLGEERVFNQFLGELLCHSLNKACFLLLLLVSKTFWVVCFCWRVLMFLSTISWTSHLLHQSYPVTRKYSIKKPIYTTSWHFIYIEISEQFLQLYKHVEIHKIISVASGPCNEPPANLEAEAAEFLHASPPGGNTTPWVFSAFPPAVFVTTTSIAGEQKKMGKAANSVHQFSAPKLVKNGCVGSSSLCRGI